MNNNYSKKVIKHFLEPENFGKMKNPDSVGEVGNPRCGDIMKIYLKVGKKDGGDIIKDIKFETLGCVAAIASSDVICGLVKQKTLEESLKIGHKDINNALGCLPAIKIHCAQLAKQALKLAIKNYRNNKNPKKSS